MTREELQTRLDLYLAAEMKILQAQDYTIGQGSTARRLTRANLAEVQAEIKAIRSEISQLDLLLTPSRRVFYLRPF